MQVHESAVKELQDQLSQKATTVDSLHQDTQQLQQQLDDKLSELTSMRRNQSSANAAHGKTAKVSSRLPSQQH